MQKSRFFLCRHSVISFIDSSNGIGIYGPRGQVIDAGSAVKLDFFDARVSILRAKPC